MKKRTPKRRYLPKSCLQCLESFIPIDKRQKFCNSQCRIDFNNDKRCREDAPAQTLKKQLVLNEKCLKKGFEHLTKTGEELINMSYLIYDGFNPNIYSEAYINTTLGTTVLWSLDFGIEGINKEKTIVKILKKINHASITPH